MSRIILTPNHPTLKQVKLGRKRPPVAKGPRLHLRNYLKALPPAPPSADYSKAADSCLSLIYANDRLGDCTIAAAYHVLGVETGNAGDLFTATDDQVISDYSKITGYNPSDPDTDQGADEEAVLNYYVQNGFANGTKLAAWVAVDATNADEVRSAMFLFENLYFGMPLADAWLDPFPSASGFVWDVAGPPDPNDGHAVCGISYDNRGVGIASWGMKGILTYGAIAEYAAGPNGGQLFTLLTPDQISKATGRAPNGFAFADLANDIATLSGTPSPLPPTPTGPTLDQAVAWATQGLTSNWPAT